MEARDAEPRRLVQAGCDLRRVHPGARPMRITAEQPLMSIMNTPSLTMLSGYELATRAERVDADNWLDDFAGAPAHVAQALGLATARSGELVMVRSRVPFSHFNMVLTLGCPAAADAQAFDAIERFYAGGGPGWHWIVVNEHTRPHELAQQLLARGYERDGAWQRVVLQEVPVDRWSAHAHGCEIVNAASAADWSGFPLDCYGMPALIGD